MPHGQSDTIPGRRPIVVPGPEPITPLQAFEAHLLRADVDSKYLHVSPALRQAGREEWLEMKAEIFAIKGLKLGAKTLAAAYVEALRELNALREVLGKPVFVPSVRKRKGSSNDA